MFRSFSGFTGVLVQQLLFLDFLILKLRNDFINLFYEHADPSFIHLQTHIFWSELFSATMTLKCEHAAAVVNPSVAVSNLYGFILSPYY